jgi:uncharacterized protein (UPF0264 family)
LKLLISPRNEAEAVEAAAGGADIIDVKNPEEGSLGASFPWIIRRVRQVTPANIEVSCTVGEAPDLPGSMALASLGAAATGVNYVKAGLFGLKTAEAAVYLMRNVTQAAKEYNPAVKVVVSGYADAARIDTVDPMLVPKIAYEAKADIAMLDTAIKDGKNLFTFLKKPQLSSFVDAAHDYGLKAALAGSLQKENLHEVYALGADIAGMRGAACTLNDRINGQITREKVQELVEIIKHAEKL